MKLLDEISSEITRLSIEQVKLQRAQLKLEHNLKGYMYNLNRARNEKNQAIIKIYTDGMAKLKPQIVSIKERIEALENKLDQLEGDYVYVKKHGELPVRETLEDVLIDFEAEVSRIQRTPPAPQQTYQNEPTDAEIEQAVNEVLEVLAPEKQEVKMKRQDWIADNMPKLKRNQKEFFERVREFEHWVTVTDVEEREARLEIMAEIREAKEKGNEALYRAKRKALADAFRSRREKIADFKRFANKGILVMDRFARTKTEPIGKIRASELLELARDLYNRFIHLFGLTTWKSAEVSEGLQGQRRDIIGKKDDDLPPLPPIESEQSIDEQSLDMSVSPLEETELSDSDDLPPLPEIESETMSMDDSTEDSEEDLPDLPPIKDWEMTPNTTKRSSVKLGDKRREAHQARKQHEAAVKARESTAQSGSESASEKDNKVEQPEVVASIFDIELPVLPGFENNEPEQNVPKESSSVAPAATEFGHYEIDFEALNADLAALDEALAVVEAKKKQDSPAKSEPVKQEPLKDLRQEQIERAHHAWQQAKGRSREDAAVSYFAVLMTPSAEMLQITIPGEEQNIPELRVVFDLRREENKELFSALLAHKKHPQAQMLIDNSNFSQLNVEDRLPILEKCIETKDPVLIDAVLSEFSQDQMQATGKRMLTLMNKIFALNDDNCSLVLLDRVKRINFEPAQLQTLFRRLLKLGDDDMTKIFIEKVMDINSVDKNGVSLLHIALNQNNAVAVRALIERGAKLDGVAKMTIERKPVSCTPWQLALDKSMYQVVDTVLEREVAKVIDAATESFKGAGHHGEKSMAKASEAKVLAFKHGQGETRPHELADWLLKNFDRARTRTAGGDRVGKVNPQSLDTKLMEQITKNSMLTQVFGVDKGFALGKDASVKERIAYRRQIVDGLKDYLQKVKAEPELRAVQKHTGK